MQDDKPSAEPSPGGDFETLLARARQGDTDSLAALLELHRMAARRFAQARLPARLRRRVSVADVVQEAHLVALKRASDLEPRGLDSFRNWLFGIVDRKVREAIRFHDLTAKRSRRREISRTARCRTGQFRGRQPTASQMAIGAETAAAAERALAALTGDHREVLRLVRSEQLPLDEVAARMGRSREAVRKLFYRALAKFRQAFDALRDVSDGQ